MVLQIVPHERPITHWGVLIPWTFQLARCDAPSFGDEAAPFPSKVRRFPFLGGSTATVYGGETRLAATIVSIMLIRGNGDVAQTYNGRGWEQVNPEEVT